MMQKCKKYSKLIKGRRCWTYLLYRKISGIHTLLGLIFIRLIPPYSDWFQAKNGLNQVCKSSTCIHHKYTSVVCLNVNARKPSAGLNCELGSWKFRNSLETRPEKILPDESTD